MESEVTDRIAPAVQEALVGGQLSCAVAFQIAERLGVEPIEVGKTADRIKVSLSHCQLGLFGYGSKVEGKHRIVKPMADVPEELREAIQGSLVDGRLPCAMAWKIATQLGRPKLDVSNAAEALGIRISHCQLGAFPKSKGHS